MEDTGGKSLHIELQKPNQISLLKTKKHPHNIIEQRYILSSYLQEKGSGHTKCPFILFVSIYVHMAG